MIFSFRVAFPFKSVYSNLQIVPPYYIKGDRKLSVINARLKTIVVTLNMICTQIL